MVADGVEHRVGVEAREQDRRRAAQQRAVEADAEAVHVEERQREHQPVAGGPAPREPERLAARQQVAVREHGALGRAGGARRVAEQREVVGLGAGRAPAGRASGRSTAGVVDDARPRAAVGERLAPRSSSTTHAAGAQSLTMCAISRARYAPFTGTTTSPRRSAATCATTRSTDGGRAHHDAVAAREPRAGEATGDAPRPPVELAFGDPAVASSCTAGGRARRPVPAHAAGQAAPRPGGRPASGSTPAGRWRAHNGSTAAEATGTARRRPVGWIDGRRARRHPSLGRVPFWIHQLVELLLGILLLVQGARTGEHTVVLVTLGSLLLLLALLQRRRARCMALDRAAPPPRPRPRRRGRARAQPARPRRSTTPSPSSCWKGAALAMAWLAFRTDWRPRAKARPDPDPVEARSRRRPSPRPLQHLPPHRPRPAIRWPGSSAPRGPGPGRRAPPARSPGRPGPQRGPGGHGRDGPRRRLRRPRRPRRAPRALREAPGSPPDARRPLGAVGPVGLVWTRGWVRSVSSP